jgi:Zn ribbon nucleic-acid-binding protein
MGDRIWWFEFCPKCKKHTLECYEHDSAELREDSCDNCGYLQKYEYIKRDGVIHVEPVAAPEKEKS